MLNHEQPVIDCNISAQSGDFHSTIRQSKETWELRDFEKKPKPVNRRQSPFLTFKGGGVPGSGRCCCVIVYDSLGRQKHFLRTQTLGWRKHTAKLCWLPEENSLVAKTITLLQARISCPFDHCVITCATSNWKIISHQWWWIDAADFISSTSSDILANIGCCGCLHFFVCIFIIMMKRKNGACNSSKKTSNVKFWTDAHTLGIRLVSRGQVSEIRTRKEAKLLHVKVHAWQESRYGEWAGNWNNRITRGWLALVSFKRENAWGGSENLTFNSVISDGESRTRRCPRFCLARGLDSDSFSGSPSDSVGSIHLRTCVISGPRGHSGGLMISSGGLQQPFRLSRRGTPSP